ncbi:cytochrome P450 [Oryctes borbonicus]|uniref:Cytochrome P450 n=1 Tax=Oryctes borbonicus TaxID=1629725 RepID=A0A0T6BC74_9SCAR|nr:cytochrome P450 [Oryctes borbonicus]
MQIFSIFAFIIVTLIAYVKWSQTHWKRRRVPHLEPSFLFGNFENPIISKSKRSMPAHFLEFYRKLKEKGLKCGGVYTYFAPMFVIADPAYNKHILLKNFHEFHIRDFYCNKKDQPVSLNLVTSEGEDWRKLRIKFNPTFTTAKMKIMFDLMMEVAKSMGNYFRGHATRKIPINAKQCGEYYTTDIVATCSFGLDCNSFKNSTFSDLVKHLMHDSFRFTRISFCFAFPKLANFLGVPLFIPKPTQYICDLLDKTVKERVGSNIARKDFRQIIMDLKRQHEINDTEAHGHCVLFLLAGFETMGVALTFALFELAVNQEIQTRLRNEINKVLNKYGGESSYEAIYSIKYLDMFINEILRKYPPVAILNRTSVTDVRLPDADFVIEKGTKIVIPVIGFHHDPEYFPEPDKFDPERFSMENKQNVKPYAYIPFGDGPRSCIGERFAKQALKVGIFSIVKGYKLKLNPTVKLPLEFESSFGLVPATDILVDIQEANQVIR